MSMKLANKKSGTSSTNESTISGSNSNSMTSLSSIGIQRLLTDNLVERIMKMALPPASDIDINSFEVRREFARDRPNLSVNTMGRNFRQMNARLSQAFATIDEVIKIFSWTNSAYTISIMLIYTHAVMKPLPTLTSLPIFYLLFGIMVPHYLHMHKPNHSIYLDGNPTPAEGPPLREAAVPAPVPELSHEFVLNMADLQNHMTIYVCVYDFINECLTKFAYFTNEKVSTVAFLLLLMTGLLNALFLDTLINYLPVRGLLLIIGWLVVIIFHPKLREWSLSTINSEETRIRILTLTNRVENMLNEYLRYTEIRERKIVRVFEIQEFSERDKCWVLIGFSNDNYTLFSDLRINEKDIAYYCAPTLDEIKPPILWEWVDVDDSWALDLEPMEWVHGGFIQYVDVDMETKWVYDLTLEGKRGAYRRRMWTNVCTREMSYNYDNINEEKEEEAAEVEDIDKFGQNVRG